jgi:aspartyl-tRNA(Asn)/glutamyl-tRNA(Gln) amidotransferase subunit A
VRGLRLGVPRHLLDHGVDDEVRACFEAAIASLVAAGAAVDAVELPSSHAGVAAYYLVATAEASANLARYDGVRYGARAPGAPTLDDMYRRTRGQGFGAEVKRRLMLGTYALSAGYYDAFYARAQQVRGIIRRDFDRALDGRHAVLMPTSPTTAFALGERTGDPVRMYLSDVFTVGPSLAGLPSLSVPCGLGATNRLPVGLQITTRAWDDAMMYRVAAAVPAPTRP